MPPPEIDFHHERSRLQFWGRLLLGLFLWGQMILQVVGLMYFWPEAVKKEGPWDDTFLGCPITQEVALIMSIAILGAMGGSTHALSSFARFAGNRELVRSWVWWYLLRAPIGIALAIVIYFVIRGGLLTTSSAADGSINPYALGAVAALAGLCSESATIKLSEVFDVLFKPNRTADKDTIEESSPALKALNPASLTRGSGDSRIALTGAGFIPGDNLLAGSTTLPMSVDSPAAATVIIPAALLVKAGEIPLSIVRSGGQPVSNVLKLTIHEQTSDDRDG